MKGMKTIGVIPARLESTRLERKLLRDLLGKPVIQHVWEHARRARLLDDVLVACDDELIRDAVRAFGGKAVLTSKDHTTGTERLAEVVNDIDVQWIVNIQGDEPLVNPLTIDDLVTLIQKDPSYVMATVVKRTRSIEEFRDPDVVKAVLDEDQNVLYFSRSPVPSLLKEGDWFYKHVGLYAYTKDFLFTFKKFPPSYLEKNERLEQLRALEHGYRIQAIETPFESIGIDTLGDLERAREILAHAEGASSLRR